MSALMICRIVAAALCLAYAGIGIKVSNWSAEEAVVIVGLLAAAVLLLVLP